MHGAPFLLLFRGFPGVSPRRLSVHKVRLSRLSRTRLARIRVGVYAQLILSASISPSKAHRHSHAAWTLLDSAIVLERWVVRCQLSSPAVLGHRFPAHTYICKVICHILLLSTSIILWSIAIHGGVAEGKQSMLSTAPDEKSINCPIIALKLHVDEEHPVLIA
jgi:hypothetical protein